MAGLRAVAVAAVLALLLSACAGAPVDGDAVTDTTPASADTDEGSSPQIADEEPADDRPVSADVGGSEFAGPAMPPDTSASPDSDTIDDGSIGDGDDISGIDPPESAGTVKPVDGVKENDPEPPSDPAENPDKSGKLRSTEVPEPLIVEEPDGADDTPVEAPLFNPLLVDDVPYEEPVLTDKPTGQPSVPESTPVSPPAGTGHGTGDSESASADVPRESGEAETTQQVGETEIDTLGPAQSAGAAVPQADNRETEEDEPPSVTVELITPAEKAAAPSRFMDSPGEFSVVLEGQGWVFRSDLSTSGEWRFLGRDLEGDSTVFTFLFEESGNWTFVFERQDLSSGGSERAVRNVSVGSDGGAVVENGPMSRQSGGSIPGNMPDDPSARAEAAREAADAGRSGEALGFWAKDADRNDQVGRDARAGIVEEAAATGNVVPLVTWLPRYIDDGADPQVLAAALEVLENQMGYDDTAMMVAEELIRYPGDPRHAEWLYRLARQLEKPGDSRDLDRAAALYGQVVEGYPLSSWRDLSEERLSWLRRHYFRVR